MKMRLTVVALAALFTIACSKKEAAAPQTVPAEAPKIAQAPAAPPAAVADDPSLAADCQKAQQILDDWSGESAQLEQAAKLLMAVIARNRDYVPAYVALSRLERKAAYQNDENYQNGGLQRSRKFAEHALKLDPKNGEAYAASAWTALALKDFDDATAAADQAEQLGARPLDVKAIRAELAFDQNDLKKALALTKEIAAAPNATIKDRSSAWEVMTDIYNRVGAVDEADRAYQEELKVDPDRPWPHGNYAAFLLQHGRVDDAIVQGERAVKLMPYPMGFAILARAYVAKANELWDAKRYDASAAYVEKAAVVAGGNPDLYYFLGVFYERASKRTGDSALVARAVGAYKRALESKAHHAAAQEALGRLAQ
jgi:tetratricopeptide (TPR) repeat protein